MVRLNESVCVGQFDKKGRSNRSFVHSVAFPVVVNHGSQSLSRSDSASSSSQTCAGKRGNEETSREPSRRCYTIALRQKTNHEALWLFFKIQKVCIIEQLKGGANICLTKKGKHFKTIYNDVYLQCLFTNIYTSRGVFINQAKRKVGLISLSQASFS